jgi:transposase-like protein
LGRGSESENVKSELLHLAVRKIVEEALEAEVNDVVGRGYYERGGSEGGYRNGYRTGRLRSAEGAIEYSAPQVSDREEPFRSKIRRKLKGRTEALEALAVEMYARGLSTRDIEEAFRDDNGQALLSRTAVSEVTEKLWAEYEAFCARDLSEFEVLYLFVDGVAERLHPGQPREAVLCAWAICADGKKILVHFAPGTKEDFASCQAFFQELKRRGLNDPLLVATDGAPGLIKAVEVCFPRSARQRCLAHRTRNLQSKVTEERWPEVRARAKACYEAPSVEVAKVLREDFVRLYQGELPSAVKCFEDDFDACIAHLRFPITHRKVIRTTNLLERLFEEERRRMKIIANAFGERPVLKLMYASLLRASERWRGLKISVFEMKQLEMIRQELDDEHRRRHAPAVSSQGSVPSQKSSRNRT